MQPLTSEVGSLGLLFDENVNRDNRTSLPSVFSGGGGGGGGAGAFPSGNLQAGNTGGVLGANNINDSPNTINNSLSAPSGSSGPSASTLQSEILSTINNVSNVYNQLFGRIDAAVNDQQRIIEDTAGRNTNQIRAELGDLNIATNRQFAARGLGSSDFRTDALGSNQRLADSEIAGENRTRDQQLAQLGQFAATERAGFEGERDFILGLRDTVNQLTDVTELQNLRDTVNARLAQAQTARAGFNTEAGFIGQLDQFSPTDRTANSLQLLIGDPSATTDAKIEIGRGVIANSGATPEEQASMWSDFLTQLGIEEDEELGL